MKIIRNKHCVVGITPQLKFGRKWYWKPQVVPHRKSMGAFQYWKDDTYSVNHEWVTHFIQIFFLWFIIYVDIPTEKCGSGKYVRYECTHYAAIDESLNSKP